MLKSPDQHGLGGEFAVWTTVIAFAGALSYFAYQYQGSVGLPAMSAEWLLPALTILCIAVFAVLHARVRSANQELSARAAQLEADIRAEVAAGRAFERDFKDKPRAAASEKEPPPAGSGA